jgi:hypothetical protein
LKDDSLEDTANLPSPEVIGEQIIGDLQEAPDEFAAALEELKK